MPLVVDDKSKDEILDGLMASIHKTQVEYCDNLDNNEKKVFLKERLDRLTMLYNAQIDKRVNRANSYMLRPLHVPGPQPEEEVRELMELIDSV